MFKLCVTLQTLLFPAQTKKCNEKNEWTQALKHKNLNTTKCNVKNGNRICSLHFVDGIPTKANPLPVMRMGYNTKWQKAWRPLSNTHYQQRKPNQRKMKQKFQ